MGPLCGTHGRGEKIVQGFGVYLYTEHCHQVETQLQLINLF
jgi:hypothetical protein